MCKYGQERGAKSIIIQAYNSNLKDFRHCQFKVIQPIIIRNCATSGGAIISSKVTILVTAINERLEEWNTHIHIQSHTHTPTHTHTLTLTLTLAHTLPHSHTLTHSHSHTHAHSHAHPHTHTFTHTLSLTHTHTHTNKKQHARYL